MRMRHYQRITVRADAVPCRAPTCGSVGAALASAQDVTDEQQEDVVGDKDQSMVAKMVGLGVTLAAQLWRHRRPSVAVSNRLAAPLKPRAALSARSNCPGGSGLARRPGSRGSDSP